MIRAFNDTTKLQPAAVTNHVLITTDTDAAINTEYTVSADCALQLPNPKSLDVGSVVSVKQQAGTTTVIDKKTKEQEIVVTYTSATYYIWSEIGRKEWIRIPNAHILGKGDSDLTEEHYTNGVLKSFNTVVPKSLYINTDGVLVTTDSNGNTSTRTVVATQTLFLNPVAIQSATSCDLIITY